MSDFYTKKYNARPLDPNSEVLITTSGTESLYAAIFGVLEAGDEVVMFEPAFPWYAPDIRLAGGVLKCVPLRFPDFRIQEEELRRACTPKTKMIIFNSPHNPTGHVARRDEIDLIAKLCIEHDAVCLSDEVYENFVFDPKLTGHHVRMCDVPGMRERTLTVGSASKMFSLTGWRVGWLYGPADLIGACRSVHSYATFCAPTPLQEGVRQALEAATKDNARVPDTDYLNELFLTNAKRLAKVMEEKFGATSSIPEGGYFLVCDISATGKSDVDFCAFLAQTHGVVAVPMTVFFPSGNTVSNLIRFSICKTPAVIDKAIQAILKN